jgi:hypothetical protein
MSLGSNINTYANNKSNTVPAEKLRHKLSTNNDNNNNSNQDALIPLVPATIINDNNANREGYSDLDCVLQQQFDDAIIIPIVALSKLQELAASPRTQSFTKTRW